MNYYHGASNPYDGPERPFFQTLVRLRLNKPHRETAVLFKINEKEVRNIFITWINLLHYHFQDIDW